MLPVVRRIKITVFSNLLAPEVFIHTVSRAEARLLFTETFNILISRHTTKGQIKGKIILL